MAGHGGSSLGVGGPAFSLDESVLNDMSALKRLGRKRSFSRANKPRACCGISFPTSPLIRLTPHPTILAFSQALLIEGIDASTKMGYVEELFDKAFMKVPVDFSLIQDVAKGLAKRALKNWFRHATGDDLKDPKIYEAVRRKTWLTFGPFRAIRVQTGELDY